MSAAAKTELFGDRLDRAVRDKRSVAVVGIDPTPALLPPEMAALAAAGEDGLVQALTDYCGGIIEAVCDLVPAVKPNIAFFEANGLAGLAIYKFVCLAAAGSGVLVIGDVKRGDIGSTAEAYSRGLLDCPRVDIPDLTAEEQEAGNLAARIGSLLGPHDALTLNPYLGSDSVLPFVRRGAARGQGFFVLVKTSNPSSAEMQDLVLAGGGTVAERCAGLAAAWGEGYVGNSGLSAVGAVVGATHPSELARYRALMPEAPFLVPGYGAQGGTAADVVPAFRADGSGAIVSASRSVLGAWKKEGGAADWRGAARRAAERMNADLRAALENAGKWSF
ncbi:MAG: orotidine-5'-phosphate decarboxylase [Planctomycetota bacterium]|jgi:orotidine-5'-phosphate decarboxylase|nr:orotidine-5'-phosphate decarboxylase [Planctomycetota bacterium]